MWYRLVRSYKDLNSAKFKVIHEIEKSLPISPYDAEWEAVGSIGRINTPSHLPIYNKKQAIGNRQVILFTCQRPSMLIGWLLPLIKSRRSVNLAA
jgi:hypothetical protein